MKNKIAKAVKDRMSEKFETFKSVSSGASVSTSILQKIRDAGNYEVGSLVKVLVYLEMNIDVYGFVPEKNMNLVCSYCGGRGVVGASDRRGVKQICEACTGTGGLVNKK